MERTPVTGAPRDACVPAPPVEHAGHGAGRDFGVSVPMRQEYPLASRIAASVQDVVRDRLPDALKQWDGHWHARLALDDADGPVPPVDVLQPEPGDVRHTQPGRSACQDKRIVALADWRAAVDCVEYAGDFVRLERRQQLLSPRSLDGEHGRRINANAPRDAKIAERQLHRVSCGLRVRHRLNPVHVVGPHVVRPEAGQGRVAVGRQPPEHVSCRGQHLHPRPWRGPAARRLHFRDDVFVILVQGRLSVSQRCWV